MNKAALAALLATLALVACIIVAVRTRGQIESIEALEEHLEVRVLSVIGLSSSSRQSAATPDAGSSWSFCGREGMSLVRGIMYLTTCSCAQSLRPRTNETALDRFVHLSACFDDGFLMYELFNLCITLSSILIPAVMGLFVLAGLVRTWYLSPAAEVRQPMSTRFAIKIVSSVSVYHHWLTDQGSCPGSAAV